MLKPTRMICRLLQQRHHLNPTPAWRLSRRSLLTNRESASHVSAVDSTGFEVEASTGFEVAASTGFEVEASTVEVAASTASIAATATVDSSVAMEEAMLSTTSSEALSADPAVAVAMALSAAGSEVAMALPAAGSEVAMALSAAGSEVATMEDLVKTD